MPNFHISKSDGNTRRCTAKTPESCTAERPEGLQNHFESKQEAEKAYEKLIEKTNHHYILSKKPITKNNSASNSHTIIDDKRTIDTSNLESSISEKEADLKSVQYVIKNIDNYDGLPGGKWAVLTSYTKEASKYTKEIYETANKIQNIKSLFSKDQINQYKENYIKQITLEEKTIQQREKDLKRRYNFLKRRNDHDSKLVYNDNMNELQNRKKQIQEEKEKLNN